MITNTLKKLPQNTFMSTFRISAFPTFSEMRCVLLYLSCVIANTGQR